MRINLVYRSKIQIIIFLLLITTIGYSQQSIIPDSLQNKTIDELENLIRKYSRDSIKATFFSDVLLAKAKQNQDPLGLAKGYYQVSFNNLHDPIKRITYLDSSITYSTNVNHRLYPVLSYTNRAGAYKEIGNYDKALDDYLKALELTDKENTNLYYVIKHNIGRLKYEIGEYEEAKEMYLDIIRFENKQNIKGSQHLISVLGLADTYRKLKQIDSASHYTNLGIKESLKDSINVYYSFVLSQGINLYYNKRYQASADSISKAIPVVKKLESHNMGAIIDGYFHLSKIYKEKDDQKMLLNTLQKIDWYFENTNYRSIEMRKAYELLINHYKSIDDKNQQLYYINKLFAVDSILDSDYKYLNKTITKKYDTPQLLEEKEKLITLLENKEKNATLKFTIAILLVFILIIIFGYVYYKNVQYKKRFKALMQYKKEMPIIEQLKPINNLSDSKSIDIPEEIITGVLERLTHFEEKKGFLSRNLTIAVLAKRLNTNSKYLSKIINIHKQKRFSLYINELRVSYVVERLKEDSKFRLYSIKAIAREIGYNNDRAFSKAFYQKTGVYPSYFIKQLEKETAYN